MHPQDIFKENQTSKLGDSPMHPLLHQQLSVRLSLHYIFITSSVMCYAWSVSLLHFLVYFTLFAVHNKLDPTFFCVGEKHAPLKLEILIGFSCLFFAVSCSLSFLATCLFSYCALDFSSRAFICLRLELYTVYMFILFIEFACCTELCVLTRK